MPDISPELLVSKGLFPENLPPVYTGDALWNALSPRQQAYSISAKASGELSTYNASKRGSQRRLFAIPHPLFAKEQGIFFRTHWADIEALFASAPGSVSRPVIDHDSTRHIRITPHRELPRIRLRRISRFKFCLVTDVSRFFYSIYTHSLPWALNGKTAAKVDTDWRSKEVFGNRLDFLIRQAQTRQTVGIPVGPDGSKIASEIIMSAVDKSFIQRSGKSPPTYVRHVDDYWIGGHSYEECEKHLVNLRAALRDFELDINEAKTRIISTKYVFGETWPSEFEEAIEDNFPRFNLANEPSDQAIATLGLIIDRATQENDDGIIRSAIRVLDKKRLWNGNWPILEHFLAQCAVQFPHSFDYVARVVAWRIRLKQAVDRSMWAEITKVAIAQHSSLGRDSETCWAIWLLKELGVRLTKPLSDLILKNCGSFVLAFLAHFPRHRMATDKNLVERLQALVTGDPYAGAFWPLSLELTHLDAAKPEWEECDTVVSLRALHRHKVSIIDWTRLPKVFTETQEPEPDDFPDYAIEDFGAEYADDTAALFADYLEFAGEAGAQDYLGDAEDDHA